MLPSINVPLLRPSQWFHVCWQVMSDVKPQLCPNSFNTHSYGCPTLTYMPSNLFLQVHLIWLWSLAPSAWTWLMQVFLGKCVRHAKQVKNKKKGFGKKAQLKCMLLCLSHLRGAFFPSRWPHCNDHSSRAWRSCLHGWAAVGAKADGGWGFVELCGRHPGGKLAEINHSRARFHTRICLHLQKVIAWTATGGWRHIQGGVITLTRLLYPLFTLSLCTFWICMCPLVALKGTVYNFSLFFL